MRMIGLIALSGAVGGLLACGNGTAPSAPEGDLSASAAATNKGLSICAWGLADFTGNGPFSYLSSHMNEDGSYDIDQYITDATPPAYIISDATAGLTTVYGDTLVVIKGNLPAASYSSWPGPNPPPTGTPVTLALDLRLLVTPRRGTGLHPLQGGQGGVAYTRYMTLSGTIGGVQITSGSGLSDVMTLGRYAHFSPPPRRATPFDWYGTNGTARFCTH